MPERSAPFPLFFRGNEIVQAVGKYGAANDTAQLIVIEIWPAVTTSTKVRSIDAVFEGVVEVVACGESVICKKTIDAAMNVLLARP